MGMLSSEFPSVIVATKYLQNLEKGGIMGGSPHTLNPIRNCGKQDKDIGTHDRINSNRTRMSPAAVPNVGRK